MVPDAEERIRARLRVPTRYGYHRMTPLLREEGLCVSHKRIQRLCRDEGLRVLRRPKKRYRVGASTVPPLACGRVNPTRCGLSTSASTGPRTCAP